MMHIPAHKQTRQDAAPGQLATQTLWMNVYRAGWFHRMNKPGCLDLHAGDFYTSHESARAQIDPHAPYVGTVSFEWFGPVQHENGPGSVPVPLSVSRKEVQTMAAV